MKKGRIAGVLGVLIAINSVAVTESRACHWCNCLTTATTVGGTLLICPAGDGPTLAEIGAVIEITVLDNSGFPVQGMPAGDFWIMSPASTSALCGASQSSTADGPTDANGRTTMSGSVAAGGFFDNNAYAIAAGWAVQGSPPCDNPLPLVLVSPDVNGDLVVDLIDFAEFGGAFLAGSVEGRFDYDGDGTLDIVDLALFGLHFQHACST